jgi:hypothetical protein
MPVTVITMVSGTPAARPEAENTTSELKLPGVPGPAVFTVIGTPPSMATVANPQASHLTPIQLTAVPVKLSVAVEAWTLDAAMVPPLNVPVSAPKVVHEPMRLVALSSERVV